MVVMATGALGPAEERRRGEFRRMVCERRGKEVEEKVTEKEEEKK